MSATMIIDDPRYTPNSREFGTTSNTSHLELQRQFQIYKFIIRLCLSPLITKRYLIKRRTYTVAHEIAPFMAIQSVMGAYQHRM